MVWNRSYALGPQLSGIVVRDALRVPGPNMEIDSMHLNGQDSSRQGGSHTTFTDFYWWRGASIMPLDNAERLIKTSRSEPFKN
jgi:hypothetical protein